MLGFGSVALAILLVRDALEAAAMLALGALIGLSLMAFALAQLRAWPGNRIGFFRDRLALVEDHREQFVNWDKVDTATLAAPTLWAAPGWAPVELTDRLTIVLRRGRQVTFRPADFGLDPLGCRDLVLRLRDEAAARDRLPEFESGLDLSRQPVVTGELFTPRI